MHPPRTSWLEVLDKADGLRQNLPERHWSRSGARVRDREAMIDVQQHTSSPLPLRTTFLLISLTLLLSVSGCRQPTNKVEAGYTAAAEDLRQRMKTALQDPATQSTILQKTHEAEEAFEKSSVLADEKAGKKHPVTAYLSGKVILDHVSTSPVDLKTHDDESSARYTAKVVLTYKTEGQSDSLNVDMPVTADQSGTWMFPDTAETIKLTKEQFDNPAATLLERAKL